MKDELCTALCTLAAELGRKVNESEVFQALRDISDEKEFSSHAAWAGARALRKQGLLTCAFSLPTLSSEQRILRTPFLTWWKGQLCLVTEMSTASVGYKLFESQETQDATSPLASWLEQWTRRVFISLPQPNLPLEVLRGEDVAESAVTLLSIYRFSHETGPWERLLDYLKQLIDEAVIEGRLIIFLDELGLIPEETVRAYISDVRSEKEAFAYVKDLLTREVRDIERGFAPYDQDPLYQRLYQILAERARKGARISVVLEDLSYELWEQIISRDKEIDPKQQGLLKLLLFAQLSQVANTVIEIARLRWEVNGWDRDQAFLLQVARLIEEKRNERPLLINLRTASRFGTETRLPSTDVRLLCYALSEVPEPEYLATESYLNLLWNNGVVLGVEETALMAVKAALGSILCTYKLGQGKSPRQAAWEAHKALVALSREDLERVRATILLEVLLGTKGEGQEGARNLLERIGRAIDKALAE